MKLSKDEVSLLLYLENRAVDYRGRVAMEKMNEDDLKSAKKWHKEGFIEFGGIVMKDHNSEGTDYVILSERAWNVAHDERVKRATKSLEMRCWLKVSEKGVE